MWKILIVYSIVYLQCGLKAKIVRKQLIINSNNHELHDWNGIWFPYPPDYDAKQDSIKSLSHDFEHCDDGQNGLDVDFDPNDKRHSYNYLCMGNRSKYAPNLNTTAMLTEYFVPPAYYPPVYCVNTSIKYIESPPTYGGYRPIAPKYGTYRYLPPQRWLHRLAQGAIVLLHHPCALPSQIKCLKDILRGCLYRHIITPSQLLSPQRPLALLSWGKSLQMSVVDEQTVVKFIKDNAKKGLMQTDDKNTTLKSYNISLISEARLVTNEQDSIICAHREM